MKIGRETARLELVDLGLADEEIVERVRLGAVVAVDADRGEPRGLSHADPRDRRRVAPFRLAHVGPPGQEGGRKRIGDLDRLDDLREIRRGRNLEGRPADQSGQLVLPLGPQSAGLGKRGGGHRDLALELMHVELGDDSALESVAGEVQRRPPGGQRALRDRLLLRQLQQLEIGVGDVAHQRQDGGAIGCLLRLQIRA